MLKKELLEILADENTQVKKEKAKPAGGKGRPKDIYKVVNGEKEIELSKQEYENLINELKNIVPGDEVLDPMVPLSEAEFEVLNRHGAPHLMYRVYKLAMASDSLKDVVQATRLMVEYGYGKAGTKEEVSEKAEYVRKGWSDAPDMPLIEVHEDT